MTLRSACSAKIVVSKMARIRCPKARAAVHSAVPAKNTKQVIFKFPCVLQIMEIPIQWTGHITFKPESRNQALLKSLEVDSESFLRSETVHLKA